MTVNDRTQGFTLVEISIVMIIIGLLIGGTFGGMKLIENMQVNRTAQDLKAFTSASVTFKDTYGRLPGDIVNPAARIPNCTDAPCATGGNGNRIIGLQGLWTQSIAATDENFTYYHHLEASGLMSSGIKNTLDMNFGEGHPKPLSAAAIALCIGIIGRLGHAQSTSQDTAFFSQARQRGMLQMEQIPESSPAV
jgi:prepilin-type N-terminal cleavage/methylation domain-containing protein